jgi:CheY-like chemotaxis protein
MDDEEDTRTVLAALLVGSSHEVADVPDGPAALEAASAFHPDVALIELGLPNMDGSRWPGDFVRNALLALRLHERDHEE